MVSLNPFEHIQLGELWNDMLLFLPNFVAGILTFAAFYVLYQGTVLLLRTALERKKVHASMINLTVKTYKYLLIGIGLVVALNQVGVRVGAALTGLGVVGVALGFSAQDTLKNYIAGITIFWDKPFTVGDYIEVSQQYGRVTEITMRSTRIRTLRNEYVIIPNQHVVDDTVINHSKNGEVRVDLPISISYADSVAHARHVLLGLADPEQDVRLSPYLRASVVVERFEESGVLLLYRLWINKAEDEIAIKNDYLEKAKEALERNHITIPFPQRVLHLKDD